MYRVLSLVAVLAGLFGFGAAREPSRYAPIEAVQGLLERVIGGQASLFKLVVLPNTTDGTDSFSVETRGNVVVLGGTSGVALASAFNWYLKYRCNSVYLWQEEQLSIPTPLPIVSPAYVSKSPVKWRYYFNVCTFGYTMAFWDWARWEREIDWMAMNGVNMPLAFTGQEYVWEHVYAAMGISSEELRTTWFSGQAFLPWQRMGNINVMGEAITQHQLVQQVLLQNRILDRQRLFGMKPVLPGFAGHVPPTLKRHFPDATITNLTWGPDFGYTAFLDPNDPLFLSIGRAFIAAQSHVYGTDHIYNADPYNEAILAAMTASDPDAVWLLQGWFLTYSAAWRDCDACAEAFLKAVPFDKLIVLDLYAEVRPYWKAHKNFFGVQFIWCMLHNFGGRTGIYGAVETINSGAPDAMTSAPNCVGIGVTPEGIHTNPGVYDMMFEFGWTNQPRDLDAWWTAWAQRRYGVIGNANAVKYWLLLRHSALNANVTKAARIQMPALSFVPSPIFVPSMQAYDPPVMESAWQALLAANLTSSTYLNDVVEVTRQVLSDKNNEAYAEMMAAFQAKNVAAFRTASQSFLNIIVDMDSILATQTMFLLGPWIAASANFSRPDSLQQISYWAFPSDSLNDYASKLWSGLLTTYYLPRWKLFIAALEHALATGTPLDYQQFLGQLWVLQAAFVHNNTYTYAVQPVGDTMAISLMLYTKYIGT